jgi:diacylglycerol kinase family enzyme
MTAFVVFNPNSAGGRTGRDWQAIEAALEQVFPLLSFFVTTAPGQAARVVRDALRDGHMEIIAVGGDGTINEALNGFFDHGAAVSPDAVFNFVHNGDTGALCRHFGIPSGWRAGVAHLKAARIRKTDVGRVACLSPAGAPLSRFFLGSASFGLSGSVAEAMGRSRIARLFGHGFARRLHAAAALWRWRETRVRLRADGHDEIAGIASVAVSPRGGAFDLSVLGGRRKARLLRDLDALAQGDAPGLRRLRSMRLTAAPTLDTQGMVLVETDGECAGTLPATFEIYPNAINLRI